MRSSIGRNAGKVPKEKRCETITQSVSLLCTNTANVAGAPPKLNLLGRCQMRTTKTTLEGPVMISPRGMKADKSDPTIVSPRARRITVTSTITNVTTVTQVSRLNLKNIPTAKLVKRPSTAPTRGLGTPRRRSGGKPTPASPGTPSSSPGALSPKKKVPLKRLSKGTPPLSKRGTPDKARIYGTPKKEEDISSPSTPSLSQTFKRPVRSISPMVASRDSSLSPPRTMSWGSVRPHEVTCREQWDALMTNDMEIADEIAATCERLAESSASVDAVAEQIREMESRDVFYYSACETRSNMSSMYYTPPPERSPSPDTEFGSVSGVLQRSLRVQDITERRGHLVQELLLDPPEPPLPPPGLNFSLEKQRPAPPPAENLGTKWERREQLIRELMESSPPRKEVTTVSCDLSSLNTGPDIKPYNKSWKPTERRFSKQPNNSPSPQVSRRISLESGPLQYR
eukprot:TRINITY_DN4330_c0_g1_i1.p1 TRINITY_DN4330_c0_g1~~TRINITY_DN4330_c0_g1_i1.p1  ORF type:complete len:455 (+),score=114.87 TRINITY_DN4330_c0_g1_i1:1665-3029(+)